MKSSLMLFAFMAVTASSSVNAQMTSNLDGRRFKVKTWDKTNTNLKTPEMLVFENGKADAPVCHIYGFDAAPYQVREKDGKILFDFISTSHTEGELRFTGHVDGNVIEGSYTWRKAGRDDLQYDFEGELKQ